MVSAEFWMADYPEMRRTTQPSAIGGPLGEPGFCIFCSTEYYGKIYIVFYIFHFQKYTNSCDSFE